MNIIFTYHRKRSRTKQASAMKKYCSKEQKFWTQFRWIQSNPSSTLCEMIRHHHTHTEHIPIYIFCAYIACARCLPRAAICLLCALVSQTKSCLSCSTKYIQFGAFTPIYSLLRKLLLLLLLLSFRCALALYLSSLFLSIPLIAHNLVYLYGMKSGKSEHSLRVLFQTVYGVEVTYSYALAYTHTTSTK